MGVPLHKSWFLIWFAWPMLANVFKCFAFTWWVIKCAFFYLLPYRMIVCWQMFAAQMYLCILHLHEGVPFWFSFLFTIFTRLLFTLLWNMGVPVHSLSIKSHFWFDTYDNCWKMYLCFFIYLVGHLVCLISFLWQDGVLA